MGSENEIQLVYKSILYYYVRLLFFVPLFTFIWDLLIIRGLGILNNHFNCIILIPLVVIPQTCKYKGRRFECGLSISCVLAGGKPVDSCSGGMIWSCCVDKDLHQESTSMGLVQNASKINSIFNNNFLNLEFYCKPNAPITIVFV